jgi:hypothetical protein
MGRLVGWSLGAVIALMISAAPAAAQSWSVGVHIGGGPVYGPYYGPAPYPYYPPPVYYPPAVVYGAPVYAAPVYRGPVYAAPVYRSRAYYPAYGYPAYRAYGPAYRGGAVVVRGNGNGRYYAAPQGRGPANYRRR